MLYEEEHFLKRFAIIISDDRFYEKYASHVGFDTGRFACSFRQKKGTRTVTSISETSPACG